MKQQNCLSMICLGFFLVVPDLTWSQTARIYGDVTSLLLNQHPNNSYLAYSSGTGDNNMDTEFSSNLYFSQDDPKLGSFFLDCNFQGYMASDLSNNPFNDSATPPQLTPSIVQLYFQGPISDSLRFTLGKKPIALGFASFFNVSNRLTPQMLPQPIPVDNNPAVIELSWQSSASLTTSGFVYFSNSTDWNQTNQALIFQFQLDPYNFDVYGYLEQEKNPYLGLDFSYQYDRLKFYTESLITTHRSQPILTDNPTGNPLSDFSLPDLSLPALQLVLGLTFACDPLDLTLEYLFRSEGLDDADRTQLFNYVLNLPLASRSQAITDAYAQFGWDANYFAFQLGYQKPTELFQGKGILIVSAGPQISEWLNELSYLSQLELSFVPNSSLQFTAYLQNLWGGSLSEFVNFQTTSVVEGLVVTYSYSSNRF